MARLPDAGVHGPLRRREAFRRDYGAARPLSADAREADAGRRSLERASKARLRAERKRDEIWTDWLEALAEWEMAEAERDEALANLRKAKKRLRAKSAECDDLLLELREG